VIKVYSHATDNTPDDPDLAVSAFIRSPAGMQWSVRTSAPASRCAADGTTQVRSAYIGHLALWWKCHGDTVAIAKWNHRGAETHCSDTSQPRQVAVGQQLLTSNDVWISISAQPLPCFAGNADSPGLV